MDKNEIMKRVDHTLLTQSATWEEIERICSQAIKYKTASVCIPPSYVKRASEYLAKKIPVCTVIGFPNGYQTTKVKMLTLIDIAIVTKCCGKNKVTINYAQNNNIYSLEK